MDEELKTKFSELWQTYFPGAELPLVLYYSEERGDIPAAKTPQGHRCIIADLNKVRKGTSLAFSRDNIGCGGGKRYTGYDKHYEPEFPYFLSCGKTGVTEGERYKRDPQIVEEFMRNSPEIDAGNQWLIFKRWDQLNENDQPEVVIFFAEPDVLSGLIFLANFDRTDAHGVKSPMCSGCASIIQHPYKEQYNDHPAGIIGMFDPSARPFVQSNKLTFAVPMNRFRQLVDYMEESFLITDTWSQIKKRFPGN